MHGYDFRPNPYGRAIEKRLTKANVLRFLQDYGPLTFSACRMRFNAQHGSVPSATRLMGILESLQKDHTVEKCGEEYVTIPTR